jgi:predicted RNA-binding Zn-ribbon protein involved in translation (DUF1610 family)
MMSCKANMASSLSILPNSGRVRTFVCPACGETIALGCERCRFCSVAIDQERAKAAADLMDRVNQACNDAEEIRAIMSLPKRGLELAFRQRTAFDVYLVPFLLARWWIRFGSLRFEDEDLAHARQDMKLYAFLLAAVVFAVILMPLLVTKLHR